MARSSLHDRVKRSASAFRKDRQEALGEMNARLRKKIAEIDKMVATSRESTIRFYRALGEEVLNVRRNSEGVYGERPMKKLERAFGVAVRTLYKAASFAEQCKPKEVDFLIGLIDKDSGHQLNYQHIVYLLALTTDKQRATFAKRAVENLWDPKELMKAIQRSKGKSKYAGPGRGHKLPKGVSKQIDQILAMSRAWHTKATVIWNGTGELDENVFANIMAEPEENLCADHMDALLAIQSLLPEMVAASKDMGKLTTKAIARIERALKKRRAADMVDESLSGPGASQREARVVDVSPPPKEPTKTKAKGKRRRAPAAAAT